MVLVKKTFLQLLPGKKGLKLRCVKIIDEKCVANYFIFEIPSHKGFFKNRLNVMIVKG